MTQTKTNNDNMTKKKKKTKTKYILFYCTHSFMYIHLIRMWYQKSKLIVVYIIKKNSNIYFKFKFSCISYIFSIQFKVVSQYIALKNAFVS